MERATDYGSVALAKLMPDKRVVTLNEAAVHAFKPIPAGMRNTLTLDNGKEFAPHKEALIYSIENKSVLL
jgi:IS30 family transposase